MVNRTQVGADSEVAAARLLRRAGFKVQNLNEFSGNAPFADLLIHGRGLRALVQVRGTTTQAEKFTTPPFAARSLDNFASLIDCAALYAFVVLPGGKRKTRFATAGTVARLSEAAELAYPGTNRYHVTLSDIVWTVEDVAGLCVRP